MCEFKSIGQKNSLKKINKMTIFLEIIHYLLKIYKNFKLYLAKTGNNHYNYPREMLPDKSCIGREA